MANAAADAAERVVRSFFGSLDASLSDAGAFTSATRAYLALFPAIESTLRYVLPTPPGADATRVDIFSNVSMARLAGSNANGSPSLLRSVADSCTGVDKASLPANTRPGGSRPGGSPMLAAFLHEGLVNCVLASYLNQNAPAIVHLSQVCGNEKNCKYGRVAYACIAERHATAACTACLPACMHA